MHDPLGQLDVEGAGLGVLVGGADGGGEVAGGAGRELRAAAVDAGLDLLHRQRHADDAGGAHGDRLDRQAQVVGRKQPHAGGVGEALLAGDGVGVAGVDHDRTQVGAVAGLPREPNRRGGGGVAGERGRRDRRRPRR